MERKIRVCVPAAIRAILLEWGSVCDPALIPMGNHDRQTLAGLYRELAATSGRTWLPRRTVATMYFNACMNSRFGLVAEVRREGKTIARWIEGVMARDPVLCGRLVEAPAVARAQHSHVAARVGD